MDHRLNIGRCCNPYNIVPHIKRKTGLRKVSAQLCEKWGLKSHNYVCHACRQKLKTERPPDIDEVNVNGAIKNIPQDVAIQDSISQNIILQDNVVQDDVEGNSDSARSVSDLATRQLSSLSDLSIEIKLPVVNNALHLLNESPIPAKEIKTSAYLIDKAENVAKNLKRSWGVASGSNSDLEIRSDDAVDMITRLKAKFHEEDTSNAEKIQILTAMPWSKRKISQVMGTSEYLARVAKELAEKKGILSMPESKPRYKVPEEVKRAVINFYQEDDVSMNMPGMKDYISVRNENGEREKRQKRLILGNIKEIFELYRQRLPNHKIGFSTFAMLRPRQCVLAGGSGTHTICVCSQHQNVKLMLMGGNLPSLTKDSRLPLKTYNECLDAIICPEPSADCYLKHCSDCPNIEVLSEFLKDLCDDNGIDEVGYCERVSKPRTYLRTVTQCASEFIEHFCEKVQELLPHSFIAKEQAAFMRALKDTLTENEFIVVCDFAENYAFVVQDAAPGFHWNNSQATVYPVVIYYQSQDELCHKSLVIISDCLNHDSIAVYVYSQIVVDYIKTLSEVVSKIYYISDGAPQQFKNCKHFSNVYYHEKDFGVPAEWHFSATAHGKGPCDGVGGIVKRLAALASLKLPPEKQITTPQKFFKWALSPKNLPNVIVKFSPYKDYEAMKIQLIERFDNTKRIPQTQKIHCIIPRGNGMMESKRISRSDRSQLCKIIKIIDQ